MSKLKSIREKANMTQEELADKSGISVRTIQRLESGKAPKGQTLKLLANALEIKEAELLDKEDTPIEANSTLLKLINLFSLPFTIFPPANIVIPLLIMFIKKKFNPLAKQIVSIQILWLIFAFFIFMFSAIMKKWYSLDNKFILIVMFLLVLSNVLIILRNSAEIDKKGKLFFRLSFNLI